MLVYMYSPALPRIEYFADFLPVILGVAATGTRVHVLASTSRVQYFLLPAISVHFRSSGR